MRVVFGVDLTYFYWSCAAGIVLAALYDILRIKRRLVHTPDLLVNIEDFICLVVFGIVIIYTAYEKNNGNLRLYRIPLGYRQCRGAVFILFVGYRNGICQKSFGFFRRSVSDYIFKDCQLRFGGSIKARRKSLCGIARR